MQNAKSLANKSCAQSVDINFVSLLLWKLLTDNAQEQCAIITHFFYGRVLERGRKGEAVQLPKFTIKCRYNFIISLFYGLQLKVLYGKVVSSFENRFIVYTEFNSECRREI